MQGASIMKEKLFLLQHSYECNDGSVETKVLGIFSNKLWAEDAISEYRNLHGFKEKPNDFYIDEYEIDRKYWEEGFEIG